MAGKMGYQYGVLVPSIRDILQGINWMKLSTGLVTMQRFQISYETKFSVFQKKIFHRSNLESWFVLGYGGTNWGYHMRYQPYCSVLQSWRNLQCPKLAQTPSIPIIVILEIPSPYVCYQKWNSHIKQKIFVLF